MSEQYVYGLHAVSALLDSQRRPVKKLYVNEDRMDKRMQSVLQTAERLGITIESLSTHQMHQRFPDTSHQGIVANTVALPVYGERDLDHLLAQSKPPALILILDGITDPHNLGACLRSADAAGVDFVVIPKDNNAGVTPVVSKIASGAAESIPIMRATNLARVIEQLKQAGVWIYGAAGEASDTLYTFDCKIPIALVMGSEGTGMRRLTRERCDGLFSLPMLGTVSSLNVSVATGICLYEILRQRS